MHLLNASLNLLKKTSIILVLLIFFGKLTGFLKDVLTTYFYGVGLETDALFLAAYLSALVYTLLYSSISLVLIPVCSEVLKRKSKASELYSAYVSLVGLSVFISLFTYIYADFIVGLSGADVNSTMYKDTVRYLALMALTFPLSTLVGIFNALQAVRRKVLLTYVTPIVNNLFFCGAIGIFHDDNDFNKVVIAGIISWCTLFLANLSYEKINVSKVMKRLSRLKLSDFTFKLIGLSSIFVLFEQLMNFIPIYFAGRGMTGDLSVFVLASKLILLVTSVTLMLVNTHALPQMSILSSNIKLKEFLLNVFDRLLLFCVPVVLITFLMSEQIVSFVFLRGEFSMQDSKNVSDILKALIFILPAQIMKDILNRAFFSWKRINFCLLITFVGGTSYYLLSLFVYPLYSIFAVVFFLFIINY
jgi:putative peptidoglycan lipid II flippase